MGEGRGFTLWGFESLIGLASGSLSFDEHERCNARLVV